MLPLCVFTVLGVFAQGCDELIKSAESQDENEVCLYLCLCLTLWLAVVLMVGRER